MTPEKLENQLKESLLKREVAPSEASWERLAARLDAVQRPARPRRPRWVYLAAASLLLVLSLRLLLPEPELPTSNGVVSGPGQTEPAALPQVEAPVENSSREVSAERTVSTPDAALAAGSMPPSAQALSEVAGFSAPEQITPVAPDTAGLGARIEAGLAAVLETVSGLEGQTGPVADAAVDSLLRQAQEAIAREQYGTSRARVDAMALLSDAEEELDQSFREQIFDKLKTGFNRVRTAVAARND